MAARTRAAVWRFSWASRRGRHAGTICQGTTPAIAQPAAHERLAADASPTYLARQLLNFRSGARNDPDAGPMQAVAGRLSDAQIIDAAAFVGSRGPATRAEMERHGG
jgi:cytochrome c553